MALYLSHEVLAALLHHARAAFPLEACGYLAGREARGQRVYPLRNMDQAADRFRLDPSEQFKAVRAMRKEGLNLLAVYHSHPQGPAWPSAEDIRWACDPSLRYLILAPKDTLYPLRSFVLQQGSLQEEQLHIVEYS
jgi:proteasome lid subunit RPN8/RPN11